MCACVQVCVCVCVCVSVHRCGCVCVCVCVRVRSGVHHLSHVRHLLGDVQEVLHVAGQVLDGDVIHVGTRLLRARPRRARRQGWRGGGGGGDGGGSRGGGGRSSGGREAPLTLGDDIAEPREGVHLHTLPPRGERERDGGAAAGRPAPTL